MPVNSRIYIPEFIDPLTHILIKSPGVFIIKGMIKIDKKTKNLVKRIKINEIAIIDHKDLDELAGKSLLEKHPKAVINVNSSISGKYPNRGPFILLKAGVTVIDNCRGNLFDILSDGDIIEIIEGSVFYKGIKIGVGNKLNLENVQVQLNKAKSNLELELKKFINNTLIYARKEKELILDIHVPDIDINFHNRHALIVVRGKDYKEDLEAVKSYIHEMKPIIIAVDGGADACLQRGYIPDVIIGDMDSITDSALQSGGEIIVHAYPDGRAPGLQRITALGLKCTTFPASGTSEDIAMLLAYEKGAELITAVGTHSHMIDFLEKGRKGMASTLLVRLKIGDKLVDAKGVSRLYKNKLQYKYFIQIILSILIPLTLISFFSPSLRQLFQLLAIKILLIFKF